MGEFLQKINDNKTLALCALCLPFLLHAVTPFTERNPMQYLFFLKTYFFKSYGRMSNWQGKKSHYWQIPGKSTVHIPSRNSDMQ